MPEQHNEQKLLRDELQRLALLLTESSTQLEDARYEKALERLTKEALDQSDDTEIEAALAALKNDNPAAYDQLLSFAEESAQCIISENGASLLVIVPLLVWSRYRNHCGQIAPNALERVAASYRSIMTSGKAQVRIGNVLLAPEHIPESFADVRRVLACMTAPLADDASSVVDLRHLIDKPPAADFADTRYLLISVSAASADDLFRSSDEDYVERARAEMDFCLETHRALEFAMIGAVYEVQPPGAFFWGWRQTENAMRVWSLKSLVDFIGSMGYKPSEVIASAAFFVPNGSDNPDAMTELRVGISPRRIPDKVVSGIAWPVMPDELEHVQTLATDILHTKGVRNVVFHEQDFPLEWCDDCGCPLYANPQGMVVHIEFADDKDASSFAPTLN